MDGIPEDMWSPYKNLHSTIEKTLAHPSGAFISKLEVCLKKHKQNFATFLKNPPKNEKSRHKLRNGLTEGVSISGQSHAMTISNDLVDESLIISEMFDLDEFIALELLCTAQRQMSQHPGLPRGLVAILLYYDGRKAMANSLRDLFQASSGVSWDTDLPKEISLLISSYTQSLVEDTNILQNILDILDKLDASSETELLTKNRAFGTKKHQNQVMELFEDIRLAMATALFNWSAQRGLPKVIAVKLLRTLSKVVSKEASGRLNNVAVTLLMALIYSYDTSILQRQEENNILVKNLPVLNEISFLEDVYEAFLDQSIQSSNSIINIAKFAFGLTLASLRHTPHHISNTLSKIIEYDEQFADDSISRKVFETVYYNILENHIIYKNPFFYRRIHTLFTDFIEFMHSKVTELRGRADETIRTITNFTKEGLDPPANLDHNFEMLMLCIGKFYKDDRPGLSLCTEYWGPYESTSNYSKSSTRSVSLFKFIRLAGELLQSILFVPYMKMIAGLTSCERSARSAFNLLKQSSGLSGSSTLSWEHFFGSLARYYSNLRQEHCAGTDTIYRSRVYNRGINPQEIEGLQAVLEVIKSVATYDEIARITMCEHPSWTCLHVLTGLLCCSVPLCLKADILNTLSAFGKTKETAIMLWNNLEMSQIIATISTTHGYSVRNIEMEIEQNESRIESFPISQGILELLYSLTTTIIPKNLGNGPRKPGYDPYLTFVINGIFLKFFNRTYKNVIEKWEIAEKCLKLFHHLAMSYEVEPQDFDDNSEQNPHPGFHIMLQLHTKSEMLRLILLIIDEVRTKLDEYNKFYGKKILEKCGLHCLNILETCLNKQSIFFQCHVACNSSHMITGLNKIMLDINPRSKQPDHIFNITTFITYNSWLPYHALAAVKILNMIFRLPKVSSQILDMFAENEVVQNEIRQGFVECIEHEVRMPISLPEEPPDSLFIIEIEIKEAIVELILNCLSHPAPNFSHLLLGLSIAKYPQTNQRFLMESSSNCTKSLITLLDNHLEMMKTITSYNMNMEKIIDHSYHLLYSLCKCQRTSDIILQYLRSCNDFLYRHIAALPFRNSQHSHVLNQMSHLLKCVAIELKISASNCQISRFQNLAELLIGTTEKNIHPNVPVELNHSYSHPLNFLAVSSLNIKVAEKSSSFLLCVLLDFVTFECKNHSRPKWEFFDNTLTEQILSECEFKNEAGNKVINIKRLHQILTDELRTIQSTIASGQRKLILQEIESILGFALQVNNARNKSFATIKLMESWGQVSEILFTCAPKTILSVAIKQEIILEILQKILSKVVPVQPVFELSVLTSGTILLLLVNLRSYFLKNEDYNKNISESQNYKNDLFFLKSNSLSLKFILKCLLDWIMISEITSQKLRINLYAALLNCLFIVKQSSVENCAETMYTTQLNKTSNKTGFLECDHIRMCVEVFMSFGEKLMNVICHDCIAGHDVCKMLALSCIDAFLDIDCLPEFIHFISTHGYLSHIIESIMRSGEDLCCALSNPYDMKSIYIYESKMTVLLRVASSHVGAELLLAEKIFGILSDMRVFSLHPELDNNFYKHKGKNKEFIPAIENRFRQILFPALNLCDCIISTLGSENRSVVSHINHFLLSHADTIEIVFRAGTPFSSIGFLQEISAITSLIARITNQETILLNDGTQSQIGMNSLRMQELMLSAFNRFIVNEALFKEMQKPENVSYEPIEMNKNLHVKYFLEISASFILFFNNAVTNHSADHRATTVLFTPINADKSSRNENNVSVFKRMSNLNVILDELTGTVEYFNSQKGNADTLLRQTSSLANITFDQDAKYSYYNLKCRYNDKQNELSICKFIIQQSLYLLWSHIDFYINCTSTVCASANETQSSKELFCEMVTMNDINVLKKTLIGIFNETFCKQLLSMSSTSPIDKGFNETILRRIKQLIQFA